MIETNTIAATSAFIASIAIDAFTAQDPVPSSPSEGPSSLRNTAVVLIACLASPPMRYWMVFEQRLLIASITVGVAMIGWHEGGQGTRLADAAYIVIMLGIMAAVYASGSTMDAKKKKMSKDAPPYLRREALASLAASCLFYSSLRLLRAALAHPSAASAVRVASERYDGTVQQTVGYAHASTTTSVALAFGGATGIGTAFALGANKELREQGMGVATVVLTVSAYAQLVAALVCTLAASEQLVSLPGIFAASACTNPSICQPAIDGRRFAIVNGCGAGLWTNGLGTLLMAYAPSIRLRSRAQQTALRSSSVSTYAVGATASLIWICTTYLSFSGADAICDYAVIAGLVSVLVTAHIDTLVGSAIFIIAIGIDLIQQWGAHGSDRVFGAFTNCSNAVLTFTLLLHLIVTGIADYGWRVLPRQAVEALDTASAIVAVMGTSLAVFLFYATAALYASYGGQLVADDQYRGGDNRYERTAAVMALGHWLPALVWLGIYGCKCEIEQLGRGWRAVTWYSALLIPVVIWAIALQGSTDAVENVRDWYGAAPLIMSGIVVGVIPWATAAWA